MATYKDSLTPLERFWRILKPDSKDIRNIYIYALFAGLVSLSLPLGIQAIVNLLQGGKVNASWIILVLFVVAGVLVIGILQIYQLRITEKLQQKIFTRAAFEFAFRIPRIKLEELYRHYAPELMNRFFDTIQVQKGLSKILIDFSTASLQIIAGLILLSVYHPFFIVFSVVLVLLVIAIFRFTAKRGLETSLEESEHKYTTAHWLEELARTATTFKLAGKTQFPLQRVDRHVGKYLDARDSHFAVLEKQYWFMVAFKVIVVLGLLGIGGILVMEQAMNIGQFIAAEIIILLVMNSVEKLVFSFDTIYDVLTALQKIGQVTDLSLEDESGVELERTNKGLKVELEKVSFSYPDTRKPVFSNVSMKLEQGEKVVLTGKNGSGKSTLLQVVAGLYNLDSGDISYDGLPKGNINADSLRSVIGDSLSQEQIFEGTVLENITMGRDNVTIEDVNWVVSSMGLERLIRRLPKGYDEVIQPKGTKLSASSVKKLILARCLVDRPRLVIVESILDHLDPEEKEPIIECLMAPDKSWTVLAVSSDPVFMRSADRVIELKEGGDIIDLDYRITEKEHSNA